MSKLKIKTHSGTQKRIKITSTGKIMRRHAGGKHFNDKKSSSRRRNTAIDAVVTGNIGKNIKRALGV